MATVAQITKHLASNPKARQALGVILKKAEIEGDLGTSTPDASSYAQALWDYIKDNPEAVAAAAMPIAGAGIGAATGRKGTRGRRALAGAGVGAGAGAGLMVLSRLVDQLRQRNEPSYGDMSGWQPPEPALNDTPVDPNDAPVGPDEGAESSPSEADLQAVLDQLQGQ